MKCPICKGTGLLAEQIARRVAEGRDLINYDSEILLKAVLWAANHAAQAGKDDYSDRLREFAQTMTESRADDGGWL